MRLRHASTGPGTRPTRGRPRASTPPRRGRAATRLARARVAGLVRIAATAPPRRDAEASNQGELLSLEVTGRAPTNSFKSDARTRAFRDSTAIIFARDGTRGRSRARNAGPRRRGGGGRRHRRARLVGAPAEEGQRARRRGRRAAAAAHGGSAEGRGVRRSSQGRVQQLQTEGLRAVQGESAEVCRSRRVVLEGH